MRLSNRGSSLGVTFSGEAAVLELGPAFYDAVRPADFPQAILRFRNDRAAAGIGLDGLSDAAWTRHFARFAPLPGSLEQPLALRYHGHQFRTYNPDLGDGRGFLFAQCRDDRGRLMDLGTKGSGTTPWSRAGDGRLTLKGAVREILATEMLESLGVDTSRTLSVIETGEELDRGDEPSPTRSAVLVRLSHSHIRYGTFQRLAALGAADDMARLTAYVLTHYFGGAGLADPYATLIDRAVTNAARQAAAMMAAGFVHGVLNTDNINITGESFDYGPYRFAAAWDPDFTAAYFDHHGLYSFGRQAEALQWNVFQLAGALRLVTPVETLRPALEEYGRRYTEALTAALLRRLGVAPFGDARDRTLAEALVTALEATRVDLDRFWFDWRGGRLRPGAADYSTPPFAAFVAQVAAFAPAATTGHPYWSDAAPCGLAHRRDRGDLGADRRRRRLVGADRQDRRDPPHGGGDAPVTRWTAAAANAWYAARPLPLGCNFVPSTAVNALEMWQADTFDAPTIDRELGLAAGLGMNAVRVFLHDLLWADPGGTVARVDAFLGLAARHGIAVMPVLFESCWDPAPLAGPQPPPRAGVHNSRWVQSPGVAALVDPAARPRLEAYVGGIVGAFAADPRIMAWDVWNEPDNGPEVARRDAATLATKAARVLPLLDAAFGWVRAAGATAPLTSAVWSGDWSAAAALTPIQACQIDNSDIVSFHNYDGADEFARRVAMAGGVRPPGAVHRIHGAAARQYLRRDPAGGAEPGASGCSTGASSAARRRPTCRGIRGKSPYLGAAPEPWFHDILDPDGTPHVAAEADLLRLRARGLSWRLFRRAAIA